MFPMFNQKKKKKDMFPMSFNYDVSAFLLFFFSFLKKKKLHEEIIASVRACFRQAF